MAKVTNTSVEAQLAGRKRPHRAPALVLAAAGFVGAMVVMAGPAAALPGTTIRISTTSASNSSSDKTVTTTCPAGKKLVGAGAILNNGGTRVIIDSIVPNGSPNTAPSAVTVKALEDETGTAANWSVTAYGVCTSLPITSVVRVSATSAANSNPTRAAIATCPHGTHTLLGSGFDIVTGNGEVNMHDLIPDLSGDGQVTVRAHEDSTGFGGTWSLTAYAVCGVVDGDVQLAQGNAAMNSTDKAATAHCADGYTALSGGVDLFSTVEGAGANLGFANNRLVIDQVRPNGSLFTTPREVTVSVREASPSAEIWWPVTYAVCLDPA
jgi:hypothetical protein